MKVLLPDGTELELPEGATGRRPRRRDRRGPGASGAGRAGGRRGPRPLGAAQRRRARRDPHRRSEGALDLIRHDAAHVMATAVMELYPGHEDLDRAADRGRLLLRLRVPGGRQGLRRRPRPDRGADAQARQGRRAVRAHASCPVDEAERYFAEQDQDYKVELIRDLVSDEGVEHRLAVPQRPLHRPLPRPARPVDRAHQGVQAAVAGGRLLARRRAQQDADPHLRHRVLLEAGPRASPRAARAGARARPPPARPAARPVHAPAGVARHAVLPARTAWS